jgi:hypothetical protein
MHFRPTIARELLLITPCSWRGYTRIYTTSVAPPSESAKNQRSTRRSRYAQEAQAATTKTTTATAIASTTGLGRSLSEQAIQNIYDECKVLGVDVRLNPQEFVERESVRARSLIGSNLPEGFQ